MLHMIVGLSMFTIYVYIYIYIAHVYTCTYVSMYECMYVNM